MKPKVRRSPKAQAEEDAMQERIRLIAERNGRKPAPVHVRFDPSVIRKPKPKETPVGAPRITNIEIEAVLNIVGCDGPVSLGDLDAQCVDLSRGRIKTALKLLADRGDIVATGQTSQRRYSLAVHDQPDDQPAPLGPPTPAENDLRVGVGLPPLANTPDLDDPYTFAGSGNRAWVTGFARGGVITGKSLIPVHFQSLAKTPLERYAHALVDQIERGDAEEHLYDRVERLLALELADREDGDQVAERAHTILQGLAA